MMGFLIVLSVGIALILILALLGWLFPPVCVACKEAKAKLLWHDTPVCRDCRERLESAKVVLDELRLSDPRAFDEALREIVTGGGRYNHDDR